MFRKLDISSAHDEPDDGLRKEAKDHGVLWSEIIHNESATNGAWHIEQIDNNAPSKNDCKRVGATSDAIGT